MPSSIRCDYRPELTIRHILGWSAENKIDLHIQPGKPMQNRHLESFNAKLRDECLNTTCFRNLADGWKRVANWREVYNGERPHSRLAYRTPNEFAKQLNI